MPDDKKPKVEEQPFFAQAGPAEGGVRELDDEQCRTVELDYADASEDPGFIFGGGTILARLKRLERRVAALEEVIVQRRPYRYPSDCEPVPAIERILLRGLRWRWWPWKRRSPNDDEG